MDEAVITQRPLNVGAFLNVWLPVIVWAIVISVLSTSYFSAAITANFIAPILRWLLPGAAPATIEVLHALIRKGAHFTEYGVLYWLLVRGPLRGRPILALAVCAIYAVLDETHQFFVPTRTASLFDAGLDFSGALFSNFLLAAIPG